MRRSVFIDGAAGTTGLEIRERLEGRAELDLIVLDPARRKDVSERRAALNDADLVILCLPDDTARESVAMIENPRSRVIDASTAHRIADGWAYGFPELEPAQAAAIAEASRVANPGCYPTGFLALVRPLVRAGLIPADWPLSVNAVSGYSGGGRAMIEDYEAPGATAPAWRGYALELAHKHLSEMQRHARIEHPPIFLPAVADVYRGMVVEVPLPLHALPRRVSLDALRDTLAAAYPDGGIVRLADQPAASIAIEADAGSDRMTLYVLGNGESGQARLVATLDNLGKGAAGAVVQNLNLMLDLPAATGLML